MSYRNKHNAKLPKSEIRNPKSKDYLHSEI